MANAHLMVDPIPNKLKIGHPNKVWLSQLNLNCLNFEANLSNLWSLYSLHVVAMSFEGDLANLANLMEIVENAHGGGVMCSLSARSSFSYEVS